ncbi:MAG TPA: hypothetical protein IAB50_00255 [Candidatus Faecivicinus avistercoris]|nr:hypothetical protein [Candidatus Faecivicinus avistercoris]
MNPKHKEKTGPKWEYSGKASRGAKVGEGNRGNDWPHAPNADQCRKSSPNKKSLTGITEIGYRDENLCLATVLNCFDGSIHGLYRDDNMKAELCEQALENTWLINHADSTIVHSNRESPFTNHTFRAALQKHKRRLPLLWQCLNGDLLCHAEEGGTLPNGHRDAKPGRSEDRNVSAYPPL